MHKVALKGWLVALFLAVGPTGGCFSNPTPHPAADAGVGVDMAAGSPDDELAESLVDAGDDAMPGIVDACSPNDDGGGCPDTRGDVGHDDGADGATDGLDLGPEPVE